VQPALTSAEIAPQEKSWPPFSAVPPPKHDVANAREDTMAVGDQTIQFGIADFGSSNTYSNHNTVTLPNPFPADDTVSVSVTEHGDVGGPNSFLNTFFAFPSLFANGEALASWKFSIDRAFFANNVPQPGDNPVLIEFHVFVNATNGSGQSDGEQDFFIDEYLVPFSPSIIEGDYSGILRHGVDDSVSFMTAQQIDLGTTTEADLVNSLLNSVANTTIPAVAVEGSMYDHVGTSKEVDNLVLNFLPNQIANAAKFGLNQQVYACEALGLAFAAGDENGGTGFATSYGPGNGSMPNTPAGDAAFAASASMKIFGSAANAHTPDAIEGFVANWKAFYTSAGIPGILNPTSDQIDLFARGAAWGDAVGVAFANNLGQLPQAAINFLEDAAQGTAKYSASLGAQPTPAPFEQGASTASAANEAQLVGVPADVQHIGM
jgi:hypothetical protein